MSNRAKTSGHGAALILATALSSCQAWDEVPPFPKVGRVDPNAYILAIPAHGNYFLDGQPVNPDVMAQYFRELANEQRNVKLFILEFEPGISPLRADWIRRQAIRSGLCLRHRCAEADWDGSQVTVYYPGRL